MRFVWSVCDSTKLIWVWDHLKWFVHFPWCLRKNLPSLEIIHQSPTVKQWNMTKIFKTTLVSQSSVFFLLLCIQLLQPSYPLPCKAKIPAGNQLIDEKMKFCNDYFQGLRFFCSIFWWYSGIYLDGLVMDGIQEYMPQVLILTSLSWWKQTAYFTLTSMFLSGEATCIDALIITFSKSLSPS